ncbi:MAG: hypothetical protein IT379_21770 [Deltaproteobacteria bacterium]|nr:hypothetical protein [Deltaproteobacteria bacterium]
MSTVGPTRAWLVMLAAAIAWSPPAVLAQQPEGARDVRDAVSTPDGAACLGRGDVAERVAQWLGRDVVDGALSIVVEIADAEERDVAFVIVRGDEVIARRRFPSLPSACGDRRAVLSLAIAIAIDATVLDALGVASSEPPPPSRLERSPAAAMSADAARPSPPPARGVRRRVPAAGRRGSRPLRFVAVAYAGASAGLLPVPALFGGASLELRIADRWALRVGGHATAITDVPLGRGAAESQLLVGRGDGCALVPVGVLGIELCAGVLAGVLEARGRGYTHPASTRLAAAWALAGVGIAWPRGSPVSLRLALDGLATVVRPSLVVEGAAGQVLATRRGPIAAVASAVGVAVSLP